MIDLTRAQWRKSTHSAGSGDACVEVADLAAVVAVRDSKDPQGPALAFTRQSFTAFAAQVKDGVLDL